MHDHNLPLQLTPFVGRAAELAELGGLLALTRLLTLVGPPGVGKTRLALELAGQALETFPDGVWLIELAPLTDPALIAREVAAVLGVPEEPGAPLEATLTAALCEQQALLVLDNCEHLVGGCADLAERLLRACPHLELLVTSREALNTAGERAWWVPGLGLPSAAAATSTEPAAVGASEAVRLFVRRARAADPSFELAAGNARAVASICARLDGLPLALELAAARLPALGVQQLAARLEAAVAAPPAAGGVDPFRLLAAGRRASQPRQQTLRAALAWSYDLLSAPERLLLNRLAVFARGWTLEAAEQVCGFAGLAAGDVLELLVQLVNKSLVVAETQDDGPRYRLLELVRQFAWEQLRLAGEEAASRQRHLAWLRALAEAAPRDLRGPTEQLWLARFELELDNIRAALAWSSATPAEARSGLALAANTWAFWYRRGRLTEGRARLEAALAASPEPSPDRALALTAACALAKVQGDEPRAEQLGAEALAVCRAVGDKRTLSLLLFGLGRSAQIRGDSAGARALTEESLALAREVGDDLGAAVALGGLGMLAHDQGDPEQAAGHFEAALALYQAQADRYGTGWSQHYLGLALQALGRSERAAELFEASLTLRQEMGDAEGIAGSLEALAAVAAARNHLRRSARLLGAAAGLRAAIGAPLPESEQAQQTRTLARLTAGLGPEELAAAWAAGAALDRDGAVAYARAAAEPDDLARPSATPPPAPRPPAAPPPGGLSPRELEVARLIARGHTNRRIAALLVISEWTVDTHVRHILTKLDVHARTQVAAWASGRGLT